LELLVPEPVTYVWQFFIPQNPMYNISFKAIPTLSIQKVISPRFLKMVDIMHAK
jgi:hypothetical protein